MRLPQIRDAAAKHILARHPELDGLVDFDISFLSVSEHHAAFELNITLTDGSKGWMKLQKRTGHTGRNANLTTLDAILDHYRVNDEGGADSFTLGINSWMIGDGDDSGAVIDEGHNVRVWVRTWWDKAA
jgi:hypothetical protein